MRLRPPPKKKRVTDWKGMRVRSVVALGNAYADLPRGTLFTVEHAGGTGIHLRSDPCPGCGGSMRITRISHHDIEPVLETPAGGESPAPTERNDP